MKMDEEDIKRIKKVEEILREEGATEIKLIEIKTNGKKTLAIAGRIANITDENKRKWILLKVGTKLKPGEKIISSVRDGFLVISFGKIKEEGKAGKDTEETAAVKSGGGRFSLEQFGIPVL